MFRHKSIEAKQKNLAIFTVISIRADQAGRHHFLNSDNYGAGPAA